MKFCDFERFFGKKLTLNDCRLAKTHLKHVLWVCKTFPEVQGIRQKKIMVIQRVERKISPQTRNFSPQEP